MRSNGSKATRQSHLTRGTLHRIDPIALKLNYLIITNNRVFKIQEGVILYEQFLFFARVQIKEDGRKRKLTIKDCKVTDAGLYSCVSNADKTEAEIVINCKRGE